MDVTALPAAVEEDDIQVGNLNATRMARQPLQSRGGGGAKRPAGRAPAGRQASAPAKPSRCATCGGRHRIRICPKTLADKDPEYQKRKAAGTLPYDKCDYRDPKGGFTCGGDHLRSHHKQAIVQHGVSRAGPRSSDGVRGAPGRGGRGRGRARGRFGQARGRGRRVTIQEMEVEDDWEDEEDGDLDDE